MSDLTDELAALQAAAEQATAAHSVNLSAIPSKRTSVAKEITQPLREFQARHNPLGNRPEAVEEERKLTAAAVSEVKKRGLVFRVLITAEGFGFGVADPSIDEAVATTLAAKLKADGAVRKFEEDNGDAIAAERTKAEADEIREALEGDDADAIRRALSGEKPTTDTTLKTTDFKEPEPERRSINDSSPEFERGGLPIRRHAMVG